MDEFPDGNDHQHEHEAPTVPSVEVESATRESMSIDEDTGIIDGAQLRDAIARVRAAKRSAEPRSNESELVVVGTLMPDRRLSNGDRDLDRLVLRSVRRKFGVGQLRRK